MSFSFHNSRDIVTVCKFHVMFLNLVISIEEINKLLINIILILLLGLFVVVLLLYTIVLYMYLYSTRLFCTVTVQDRIIHVLVLYMIVLVM